jgi:hypothetical protein
MGYGDWTINGITPRWITGDGVDWTEFPKVTLHCAAYPDDFNADARDEIEAFKTIAADVINNKPLMNGGTDLQVSRDGQIVTITEGNNSWQGALYYPQFIETEFADQLIQWDLIFELQLVNLPAYAIYSPDYRLYRNIDYQCWTEDVPAQTGGTVSAFPGTVSDTPVANGTWGWENQGLISGDDGYTAHAYNDSGGVGGSKQLIANNFGFNIPSDMFVSRVQVKIKYANNSRVRSPYFNIAKHYMTLEGPNMGSPVDETIKDYSQGTDPSNMQTIVYDTLDRSIPYFSKNPADYNSSDFKVKYSATLDKYKEVWIDYIQVIITYVPKDQDMSSDPNAAGREIGIMTITEDRAVKQVEVQGNACNLPATLAVNGNIQSWHYSHDHNTDDTGEDGLETLTFTISPPSMILSFLSSQHLAPVDGVNSAALNSGCYLKQVKVVYE